MPLIVEMLTPQEIEATWKAKARAENFAEYVSFINKRNVGDSFRLTVTKETGSAAVLRHNFNEAAKERTTTDASGKVQPAAVMLRWKVDSHTERKVSKAKDGKTTETDAKVVDKLTALVIASVAKKARAKKDADVPASGTSSPAAATKTGA